MPETTMATTKANIIEEPTVVYPEYAAGLGDAICAMYAVCGAAEATNKVVRYYTPHSAWLQRAHHPLVCVEHMDMSITEGIPFDGGDEECYYKQMANAVSRVDDYCQHIATKLCIPPFAPSWPKVRHHVHGKRLPSRVVISPVIAHLDSPRMWPLERWVAVVQAIRSEKYRVAVVCSRFHREQMLESFGGLEVDLYIDQPASVILDLLTCAPCVLSLDSGIAHVAGMLGCSTFVLHAGGLPHKFLFPSQLAPSVRSIVPQLTPPLPRTDGNAEAMQQLTVEQVLQTVLGDC